VIKFKYKSNTTKCDLEMFTICISRPHKWYTVGIAVLMKDTVENSRIFLNT